MNSINFILMIGELLGRLIGFFVIIGLAGYIGGSIGIERREQHNKTPGNRRIPNQWGDTEGLYLLYYVFWISLGLALLNTAVTYQSSWLFSLCIVGISSSVAAVFVGYISFYTTC
jgi:hypothetical protein